MAFMSVAMGEHKEYFLISDELEECVFCKYNGIGLPVGTYDDDMDPPGDEELAWEIANVFNMFPSVRQFEVVYMFWGNLSAPGYMDQTDYVRATPKRMLHNNSLTCISTAMTSTWTMNSGLIGSGWRSLLKEGKYENPNADDPRG